MNDFQAMQKFEKMINSIEEARDIAQELGEDLIYDALDKIRDDLSNKYDEEYANG